MCANHVTWASSVTFCGNRVTVLVLIYVSTLSDFRGISTQAMRWYVRCYTKETGTAGLWSAIVNSQQTARARHLRHQSICLRLLSGNKNIYRQCAFETFISFLLPRNFSIWNIWNLGKMARHTFYHLTTVVQNATLAPYLTQTPVQQEWFCLFAVLNTTCQTHNLQACSTDYQWLQREADEKFKTTRQKKHEKSLRIRDVYGNQRRKNK
jgi:hypothetical protein